MIFEQDLRVSEQSSAVAPPLIFAEFDYFDHHFKVLHLTYPSSKISRFIVRDEMDEEHARIGGYLRSYRPADRLFLSKRIAFNVTSSNNSRVNDLTAVKNPGHIPHIVAETIVQIVSQSKVYEWISSANLTTKGGGGMYQYIQSNFPNLVAVELRGKSYRVTRR